MSEADFMTICRSIESLVKSQEAAMLPEQRYEDLQKICTDTRSAAEKGDLEEAHRLFTFARDMLDEENNISGTE